MDWFLFWITYAGLTSLVIISYVFAYADKMLTVSQMRSHGAGFRKGIPFLGHLAAAYGDLALSFLLATLVGLYGGEWRSWQVNAVGVVALGLSGLMHWTYIEGGKHFPEAHTYGGRLTLVGWVHVLYMAWAFTIIGLFFVYTTDPSPFWVYLSAVWLWLHVIIGVHIPMRLVRTTWFPYRGVLDTGAIGSIVSASAALVLFSWVALR